jgi:hypothetical protein
MEQGAPIELRRPAADRYGILLIAGVVGFGALMLAVAGLALAADPATQGGGAAVFLLVMAGFLGALLLVLGNEALARWRTRIRFDGDALQLYLPRRRSYVPAPTVDGRLPLSEIEAVETRTEAFRSAGNTVLQQAYALRLADGSRLLLGADRRWMAPFYGQAAATLAERTGTPIVDLGTVDGQAGKLMLRGQQVPSWEAESLPPALAETRVRQESRAWQILTIVLFVLVLIRLLLLYLP